MNATWTYILVIVALAVIATLSIKSCSDKDRGATTAPTYTERQIDSVNRVYQESIKEKERLAAEKNRISHIKDSVLLIADETARKLEIQTLKVKVLTREAELAKKKGTSNNDYTQYIAACDSLLPLVDSLTVLADNSRSENRALINSYDSLLSTNSLNAGRLEFERDFYKAKFDNAALVALQLEDSNKSLSKKATKRLGIGPSVGVTYYDSRVQPTAGISLQWHLIRF